MWFCTGIVHISSWLCHICGMKFKTSENTCKKLLSLISSHFITPWIYLGPRFWIPTKVYKASLQGSLVPISIWLGLILSSTFFLPGVQLSLLQPPLNQWLQSMAREEGWQLCRNCMAKNSIQGVGWSSRTIFLIFMKNTSGIFLLLLSEESSREKTQSKGCKKFIC